MAGIKWGIISGSAALVISVLLGIISGVQPIYIFLRSLIFVCVFFGMGLGIHVLVNNFFPEILAFGEEPASGEALAQPGSLVNITLANAGEYALPEMYRNSDDTREMGNIEDLLSGTFKPRTENDFSDISSPSAPAPGLGGIDRNVEEDYNSMGGLPASGTEDFNFKDSPPPKSAPPEKPEFTPIFEDDSAGLGGLPDLDMMARAFSSGYGGEPEPAAQQPQFEEVEQPARYNKGNKPQMLQGDFNPKELAEGLRTILSKDKQ